MAIYTDPKNDFSHSLAPFRMAILLLARISYMKEKLVSCYQPGSGFSIYAF